MTILFSILAVLGDRFGKITDKFNFNKSKIHPDQEFFLVFISMFVGITGFILLTGSTFPILTAITVVVIIAIVVISYLENIFEFEGVKLKSLSYREPLIDFQPLLTSFLAYLLFPSEREIKFIIAIILGVAILYFTKKDRKHIFLFDKGTLYIILAIIFSSLLANLYKFSLDFLSSENIFFFRITGILFLWITFHFMRKNTFRDMNKKSSVIGLLAGAFYFIGGLATLLSIEFLGLNFTVMILMLAPAVTYVLSHIILKEKAKPKQIISSILLIGVIVITLIM